MFAPPLRQLISLTPYVVAQDAGGDTVYLADIGPILIYLAEAGPNERFVKIKEQGFADGVWGSQQLAMNTGLVDFDLPNVKPGRYLIRAELSESARVLIHV